MASPSALTRSFCLGIALLSGTLSFAQNLNTDSLLVVIASAKADSTKIDAMLLLANYQIKHLMDDSLGLRTLEQARELSTLKGYSNGLTQVWITTGNFYRSKSKWEAAIDAYRNAIAAAADIDNPEMRNRSKMMAHNNLGGIYNFNGDFATAIGQRLKALEITEAHFPDNYTNSGIILLNIASDYRQLKIPAKSIEYLDRTAVFFDSLSQRLQMEFYIEYYNGFAQKGDTTRAAEKLEQLKTGLANFDLSAFQILDYGMIYAELAGSFARDFAGDYAAALVQFQNALDISRKLEDPNKAAESLWNIGKTQHMDGSHTLAIGTLAAARDSSKAYGLKNLTRKITTDLAQACIAAGDYEGATAALSENVQLHNEIYDETRTAEISFLEAKYESAKKEREIAVLKLENANRELQVLRRDRSLWVGGVSALALLLVAGFGYRSNRQKRIIAEREKDLQTQRANYLEKQQQVVSLQSMINGQESERSRVAKDLHDSMGGLFSTVKMYLSALADAQPALRGEPLFANSMDLISNAAEEIRRIAHDMMPEVLLKLGLVEAVSQLINNLNAAGTLRFSFQHFGVDTRYAQAFERMLYRIIQELMNNILKHAQATEVLVQFVEENNVLHATVEDNGRGFDAHAQQAPAAGLDSVRHRVQYLNGSIAIDSENAVGTTVMMEFLLDRG